MKKIIALMLVILTLAALFVSCADDNNPPDNGTSSTDNSGNPIPDGFASVNETVYVIAESGLNVRNTPNAETDDNKVGSLAYGKDVTRTGVNEATGWSRIMYNNEIAYVKSEFLSATKPDDISNTTEATGTDVADDKFTACNDATEVYVTDSSNNDAHIENGDASVYLAPNRSKPAGITLKDGTAVKRVAVYYEKEDDHTYGWSKIEVTADGETKTYFIRNSQLKIEMVK